MNMPKEVANALNFHSENMLYHAMYDIYELGSVEAVESFNKWKSEVDFSGKGMIQNAEQRIYDNESAINRMF